MTACVFFVFGVLQKLFISVYVLMGSQRHLLAMRLREIMLAAWWPLNGGNIAPGEKHDGNTGGKHRWKTPVETPVENTESRAE